MSRGFLLAFLACAATPRAGYRREQQMLLVHRLAAYQPGFHIQRCEALKTSAATCDEDGMDADDCGIDLFEDDKSELGCK